MLENVLKALDEALLTERMRTKWETERREKAEEKSRELTAQLEAVTAELAETKERYRELKQGLEDI